MSSSDGLSQPSLTAFPVNGSIAVPKEEPSTAHVLTPDRRKLGTTDWQPVTPSHTVL